MDDHDQRFKMLLHEFLGDFLRLAVPEWADRFDTSAVEWLTQEVFPDPPSGERRRADVVAKLPLRPGVVSPLASTKGPWLTLIHVEIESEESVAALRERMYLYYHDLRRRYGLPVLPIALFLRVGYNGLGQEEYRESYWNEEILRFRYRYVGLPALDASTYLAGDNWLAVAMTSLMRRPRERQPQMQAEAMVHLLHAPVNDQQKHLLCECLDNYKEFDEQQEQEYQHMIQQQAGPEHKGVTYGWIGQGRKQGQRELVQAILEKRFGPISEQVKQRVEAWPLDQLSELAFAIPTAPSLQALGLEE